MPRLCFKTRLDGTTVQLVRHIYSPELKRSRTLTLGSLPLDADPEDVRHGLRLRPGVELADDEWLMIAEWLRVHGDVEAARRRAISAERIRQAVLAERAKDAGDIFEQAVQALDAVTAALPRLTKDNGELAWTNLRPRYLAINAAAERLLRCAQACGVAKTARRMKSNSRRSPTE
ncbi:MAG: hypothetical protein AB1514_12395 [Pseudomonadota bacterium]